uniref:Uncharacterized protein n=1 Tax=Aegilops tauschii subsp. strangulata TaxID=200361 RepID=A0A453JJ45_AEGTS
MDQRGFVRKSIVRISFKWPNPDNKGKILTVVLPGTIVSIKDDGSCVVLADDTFFRQENCPFVVNLPTAGGYDGVPVAPSMQFFVDGFCALVLQVQPNGYVPPVTFETGPVRREEKVYGFLFPQEDFFTPTMYCPGNVTALGSVSYVLNGNPIPREVPILPV